jgi:general stress protein YciG
MSGTSEGARLTARKLLEQNPNHFRELSKKAQKPRGGKNSVGSFSTGSDRAKEAGKRGGQASRRSAAKNQGAYDNNIVGKVELSYTDFEADE